MRDWRATTTSSSSGTAAVVLDAALGITFEAICDMLVATLPRNTRRRLQGDLLAVTRAMLPFPLRLPGTRFHAGLQARKRIMEVLRREIASRRRNSNGSLEQRGHGDMDFLQSLLLRSRQESGSTDEAPLTDEQMILDNILTLIIAISCRQQRLPRNLKSGRFSWRWHTRTRIPPLRSNMSAAWILHTRR